MDVPAPSADHTVPVTDPAAARSLTARAASSDEAEQIAQEAPRHRRFTVAPITTACVR